MPLVLTETTDHTAVLTINRPERHNSLIPELLDDLHTAVADIAHNEQIRAVIIQANGRSFSTGGDVRAFYEHRNDIVAYASRTVGLLNDVILSLLDLPVPVITAVHGIVTGGSLGFLLAADEVLICPSATVAPYDSVVVFSPDGGWTSMLPQLIGAKRTADILNHNRAITAEQALDWGLATQIVPAGNLRRIALQEADDIAAKVPGSLRNTKQLLRLHHHHLGHDLAARLNQEREAFLRQIEQSETLAGMKRFLKIA